MLHEKINESDCLVPTFSLSAVSDSPLDTFDSSKASVIINHPDLTREESVALCCLPGVLELLDSLYKRNPDCNPDCCHSLDTDYALAIFKYYRYLWLVIGIMEDHPLIDFSFVLPDFPNIGVLSETFDDEEGLIDCMNSFTTFQDFIYMNVRSFCKSYSHYKLTGEVNFLTVWD